MASEGDRMRKFFIKLPERGETPYLTRISVLLIRDRIEYDRIRQHLVDLGARIERETAPVALWAEFRHDEAAPAEATVRQLMSEGFFDLNTPIACGGT